MRMNSKSVRRFSGEGAVTKMLLYPNPTDPLNGEAAALLMREPEAYNKKVKGDALASMQSPICK